MRCTIPGVALSLLEEGQGSTFSVQSYLVLKQKVRPSSHLPTFVTQDRRGSKYLGGC